MHASISNNKVKAIGDIGSPRSADIKFPEKIDYPISLHLGANAASDWSDAEFENFAEQLPHRLLSVGIDAKMPANRLVFQKRSVKQIRDVKLMGQVRTSAMDEFLEHYNLVDTETSLGGNTNEVEADGTQKGTRQEAHSLR